MNCRRRGTELDLGTWPEFDSSALPVGDREVFLARRRALELYVQRAALGQIKAETGVDRRQLYRLLDRCAELHEDGRIYGFRALVRYSRVAAYERTAPLRLHPMGGSRGTAGAFITLLQAHPGLGSWIDRQVRDKRIVLEQLHSADGLRIRLRGLKHLHLAFLRECRALELTAADYPFNTERMGIRALAAVTQARCLQSFARGARLAGATHLKGNPGDRASAVAPTAKRALEVVEFDGHRLDVRLKVVMRDPLGFEQEFKIERVWLLVIIDVWSRAVLGYHVSLNREYSRYDVIRTIEAALEPHRARTFTLPGVGCGALGGFPSGKLPELGYAIWQWFKLDNDRANLADDVRHALADFVGCFVDAGPPHTVNVRRTTLLPRRTWCAEVDAMRWRQQSVNPS